jgi:glycosyltransferase involved in cell wall biosynthesis
LFALGLTALPLRSRPDVVIGTCPSLAGGALAAVAAHVHRVPYALVFQDLMGQAARQSGMPGGARVACAVGNAELALARNATAVGVIAEGFRSYLERGGVQSERIHRLRNWTRRAEPTESVAETRLRLGWRDDEFVCLHGGNLGRKQGLDNLVDTAALLRDEKIRIVLAGDGNDRERLEARARELALDRLQFVELQGPGRWESVMAASDVLLVNQRASVTDMSLPSKLTSYFAAGRPVVAAASDDSETAREIGAARAGVVVAPDEPERFRDAILALESDPATAAELGVSGRRYAERVLFPEVVLADYDRFLELVAETGRGGALPLPATH